MKRIGLDIETTLDHKTIHVVKTVDIDTGEVKTWNEASSLAGFIAESTLVTGHNIIGFDSRVLMKQWNLKIPLKKMYDTLTVSRLLNPSRETGHSLASWGEALGLKKTEYSRLWCWLKDRREEYPGECFDRPHLPLLNDYCEQDVRVLRVLFLHLESEVKKLGFSQQSLDLEHEVADIIAQQIEDGFKLDVQRATLLLTDLKGRMAEIYEQMQTKWPAYAVERYSEKTGKRLKDGLVTFNPGSRRQVGDKLKSLGWVPEKFTPTGQPQIDEGTLAGVDIPEALPIVQYFTLQKLTGFVEGWFEHLGRDGRVHGSVISNGAATGRMTHSGPNVAQTPAIKKGKDKTVLMGLEGGYGYECRECWTAEDGMVLVGCDASGLELRMLANRMGDPEYIKAVTEGDVHTMNMEAAGIDTRDNAKTFIYAYLYGAGDEKIGKIVGGTAKHGRKLKAAFLAKTPALKKLKERLEKSFQRGYCVGLDGRRVWLASEHSALNYLLQGDGAVVMKQALVLCNRKLTEQGIRYKFTANVHDEWQIETTLQSAELVGQVAQAAIVEAGVVLGLKCPLAAEFKVGKTWAHTH